MALDLCQANYQTFVDNSSEIYSKECRRCKERKKIESVCDFIGLNDNKLHHKFNRRKKDS